MRGVVIHKTGEKNVNCTEISNEATCRTSNGSL